MTNFPLITTLTLLPLVGGVIVALLPSRQRAARAVGLGFSVLALGLGFLIAADLAFVFMGGLAGVAIGVALWGLHMGFTQGLLASLVADTSPAELRGTAYGVFNLLTGLAALVASILAGALWDFNGSQATFIASAILAGLALASLVAVRRRAPS